MESSRKRRRVPEVNVDLTGTKFGALRRLLHHLRPLILEVNVDLTGSKFGALRRLLHHLRPLILEAIAAPDYRNNRAVPSIRKGLRQIQETCKQLRAETVSLAKQKKPTDGPPPAFATPPTTLEEQQSSSAKRPREEDRIPTPNPNLNLNSNPTDPTKKRIQECPIFLDEPEENPIVGNSPDGLNFVLVNPLIGGSPEGWNFIIFRNQAKKVTPSRK